ncbi:DUF4421 domain-containing protein [Cecembia sp.]|uniref:DUF4421 domain-containing protein n=1 Tax=Cecembia sp. TaxID=1898110 RepID=UPI0025BCD1AA|nr:DUF4421 domain-containing protein [Cecembia sp.]
MLRFLLLEKAISFNFFLITIIAFWFFFDPNTLQAQDSTYYVDYKQQVTGRLYTSRKYTSLVVNDNLNDYRWRFEPNSTLNLGVGATYNDFTLNLALGFGFMNPDRGTGETRYLDLQAHLYPKNFVIDFFGQFYRGYYIERFNGETPGVLGSIYPNLRLNMIGGNFQYLLSGDKLSLKAAFLQSAWQKKSAGSFLIGLEAYGGWANNEGLILPTELVPLNRNFSGLGFLQVGPNAGYVHTFVFWKRFFLTGMLSANVDLGRSFLDLESGREYKWGVQPNFFARGFLGYNGPKWSLNANYVRSNVRFSKVGDFNSSFITGNYRINFIYRFAPGPKLQKYLDYVDPGRYIPALAGQKSKN